MALPIPSLQQAGRGNVGMQINEYARVLLQLGKPFDPERVPGMPAANRERIVGAGSEITHLWLWPQTAQVRMGLKVRKNLFGKKHEVVPLSAGMALSPTMTEGAVELHAKMPVLCIDEHQAGTHYRVGQFEGLTIAARTGLANGVIVRVRAHPESEAARSADPLGPFPTLRPGQDVFGSSSAAPLAPLVAVAGRRIMASPAWALSDKREGLLLSVFPAQLASSVEFLDDLQVRGRLWAILGENPALQPYLSWLRIDVQDGVVYLGGRLPQARLRNSARQDIWHVPGVVAIEDTLRIEGR